MWIFERGVEERVIRGAGKRGVTDVTVVNTVPPLTVAAYSWGSANYSRLSFTSQVSSRQSISSFCAKDPTGSEYVCCVSTLDPTSTTELTLNGPSKYVWEGVYVVGREGGYSSFLSGMCGLGGGGRGTNLTAAAAARLKHLLKAVHSSGHDHDTTVERWECDPIITNRPSICTPWRWRGAEHRHCSSILRNSRP